jgi:hypothetical protein
MYPTSQPGGFYGSRLGNEGAFKKEIPFIFPEAISQVGPKRGSSPYAEPDRDLLENLDPFGKVKRNQQPTQNSPQPPIQLELPLAQGGVFNTLGNVAGVAAQLAQGGPVNPTYPPGHPLYGTPINFPGTNKPIDLNQAEFEGLQRMRRSGIIPKIPY